MDSYRWFWRKQRARMGRMGCVLSLEHLSYTALCKSFLCLSLFPSSPGRMISLHICFHWCVPKKEPCCDDLEFVVGMEPCFSCSFCFFESYDSGILMVHEGGVFLMMMVVQERLETPKIHCFKRAFLPNTECMLC